MIRLWHILLVVTGEDTAQDAARRPLRVVTSKIYRKARSRFVTLTAITCVLYIVLASAAAHAVDKTQSDAPLVALASSFRSVWPILTQAYQKELESPPPQASFASSGLLSTQILRGAPFELFLSADQRTVARILEAGKTQSAPVPLAIGTLSLVAVRNADKHPDGAPTLEQIRESMENGGSLKIAIPNPRHAPYGIAAQQALSTAGLWPVSHSMLLNAENASQALQYVLSGAASIALVPTTLVTKANFDIHITSIDPSTYEPVIHHLAILHTAGEQARKFSQWLRSDNAMSILRTYGLSAPDL